MPARFSFVEADIDGEGKRWRLMVDAGEFLTLTDEDFTVTRSEAEDNGDQIIGPFSVDQFIEAVRASRAALAGPHHDVRSGAGVNSTLTRTIGPENISAVRGNVADGDSYVSMKCGTGQWISTSSAVGSHSLNPGRISSYFVPSFSAM